MEGFTRIRAGTGHSRLQLSLRRGLSSTAPAHLEDSPGHTRAPDVQALRTGRPCPAINPVQR
jgi:hypothetical protein